MANDKCQKSEKLHTSQNYNLSLQRPSTILKFLFY